MSKVDEDEGLKSMHEQFLVAEAVIHDVERQGRSGSSMESRVAKAVTILENLTKEVSQIGLFSTNEIVEEQPTSSLPFLLLPGYLGYFHSTSTAGVSERAEDLRKAKVYYRDFLERVTSYGVINLRLPWTLEEGGPDVVDPSIPRSGFLDGKPSMTAEDFRQAKINRYRMEKELKEAMETAKQQLKRNAGDESYLRELYIAQIRYWALKLFEDLSSIEQEIPLAEQVAAMHLAREAGEVPKIEKVPPIPLKPYTIVRDQEQKRVFGVGYPAAPSLTVDEWYTKRFEQPGSSTAPGMGPSSSKQLEAGDSSDTDDEEKLEEKRQKALAFDEYKDFNRRGCGNTHNKG